MDTPSASEFQIITIGHDELDHTHSLPSFDRRPHSSSPFTQLPLPATASHQHQHDRLDIPAMPGGLSTSSMTPPIGFIPPPPPITPGSSQSELASSPGTRASLGRPKRQSSSHVPLVNVPPPVNSVGVTSPSSQGPPPLSPPPKQYTSRQRNTASSPSLHPVPSLISKGIPPAPVSHGKLTINTRSPIPDPHSPRYASDSSAGYSAGSIDPPSSPSPLSNPNLQQLERKRQSYLQARYRKEYNVSGPRVELTPEHGKGFRRVRSWKERRVTLKPSGYEPIIHRVTSNLLSTYIRVNPAFSYQSNHNPRRVLTKPSKPAHNNGRDNEDWDYLLYVNDIIGSQEGRQYRILDILGQGTFGQVAKCVNIKTKEAVAVKVIKNKPAYHNQSLMEVAIVELLNHTFDPNDAHHLVRMKDHFIHHNHLCIIFEMLSVNLYELIKQNQFRGLSTNLVRIFVRQILDALTVLNKARIIHCDLKPENILLKNLESPNIKVIDFGSACHENQTVYTYIQSRFYRSPEVLLGLPYTSSIDMWSLGCIAAELFLGLPLFPGSSEYNQVGRIVEMLRLPPVYMCEKGKSARNFFERRIGPDGRPFYMMKTPEAYMKEHGTVEQPSKRYFNGTTLPEVINSYPFSRKGVSEADISKETHNRRCFIDFLQGLLNINPFERWTPQQARMHPFITGERYAGPFIPPGVRTAAPPTPPTTLSTEAESSYQEPIKRRPRANTISSLHETLPPQLQRLAVIQRQRGAEGTVRHNSGLRTEVEPVEDPDIAEREAEQSVEPERTPDIAIHKAETFDHSEDTHPSPSVNAYSGPRSVIEGRPSKLPDAENSSIESPRSRSANSSPFVSARQSTLSPGSPQSVASHHTTIEEEAMSEDVQSGVASGGATSTTNNTRHLSPISSNTQARMMHDSSPCPFAGKRSAVTSQSQSYPTILEERRTVSVIVQGRNADPGLQQITENISQMHLSPNDANRHGGQHLGIMHRDPSAYSLHDTQDAYHQRLQVEVKVYELAQRMYEAGAFKAQNEVTAEWEERSRGEMDSLSGSLPTVYPLRKARSQMIDSGDNRSVSPTGYIGSAAAGGNTGYFPLALLARNSALTQSQNMALAEDRLAFLMGEGHPRHGITGERSALPSRRPSLYGSVEWDPFGDLERGISSSAPGSQFSSRRGSIADLRAVEDGKSLHAAHAAAVAMRLAAAGASGMTADQLPHSRRGSSNSKAEAPLHASSSAGLSEVLPHTGHFRGSMIDNPALSNAQVEARRSSLVAINMGLLPGEELEHAKSIGALTGNHSRYNIGLQGEELATKGGMGYGRHNDGPYSSTSPTSPNYPNLPGHAPSQQAPVYTPANAGHSSHAHATHAAPPKAGDQLRGSFDPTADWRVQLARAAAYTSQLVGSVGSEDSLTGTDRALLAHNHNALPLPPSQHAVSNAHGQSGSFMKSPGASSVQNQEIRGENMHGSTERRSMESGGSGITSPLRYPYNVHGIHVEAAGVSRAGSASLSPRSHPIHSRSIAHQALQPHFHEMGLSPPSSGELALPWHQQQGSDSKIWPRLLPNSGLAYSHWNGDPPLRGESGDARIPTKGESLGVGGKTSPLPPPYTTPSPTGSPAADLYRKAKSISWGSLSTGLLAGGVESETGSERSRHSTGLSLGGILSGRRGGPGKGISPVPSSSAAALESGALADDEQSKDEKYWLRRRRKSEDEEV